MVFRSTGSTATLTAGKTYLDGAVHAATVVYTGGDSRLHADGFQVASASQTGTIKQASGEINIGRFGTWGGGYTGSLLWVLAHTRALTPSEVAWLHKEPYAFFSAQAWRRYFDMALPAPAGGWGHLLGQERNRLVRTA